MSTTFHTKQRRGFAKGSFQQVYVCRCCKRKTRPTGTGDNDGVQLCVECYDLAGEDNHYNDNGKFYGSAGEVLSNIADVAAKGGDVSCWAELKAKAEKALRLTSTVTVELDPDILRETLIALRDRRHTLQQDLLRCAARSLPQAVADIAQRQLERVDAAGTALAAAVKEVF